MPISPDQAAKKNLDSIEVRLKQAIAQIDKELSASYFGDNTVCVSIENCHARVKKEVLMVYSEAGWEVTSKSSSHRNEQYESFTFKKRRPAPAEPYDFGPMHRPDVNWRD
jgi:hypothetical protein